MPTQTLPKGLRKPEAAEINFAVKKFKKLPKRDRVRLANAIRNNPTDTEAYATAGLEVFMLMAKADGPELTRHMNKAMGMNVDLYIVWPRDYAGKAAQMTEFFRNNLSSKPDTDEIGPINLNAL